MLRELLETSPRLSYPRHEDIELLLGDGALLDMREKAILEIDVTPADVKKSANGFIHGDLLRCHPYTLTPFDPNHLLHGRVNNSV